MKKCQGFGCRHVPDAVRLSHLRSELGEEFVDGNTNRSRELEFLSEAGPDFDTNRNRFREVVPEAGNVQECFVEREAFDQWGEASKNAEDALGSSLIFAVIRREDNRHRAETPGVNHGHRRTNAVSASLVRRSGYDAAAARAADQHRAPAQILSLPTFDLDKERIHVDVQDGFGEPVGLHVLKVAESLQARVLHSRAMASRVHLVRHGEVENPDHIVYADLQEFCLSTRGNTQAREAAVYLADRPISAVCSSPLTRAVQTALTIAAPHGIGIDVVDDLTEFGLSVRWGGCPWEELDQQFPGEVAAYLDHPWDLPFSPESLEEMAGRVEASIRRQHLAHADGELVVVSHQDPVQAARIALTGRSVFSFGDDKPGHAEVITLEPGTHWRETERWSPASKSRPFPPPKEVAGS